MYSRRNDTTRPSRSTARAISLAPDEPLPLGNLAGIYLTLNRPDEARRLLEDAIARGLDSASFRTELYTLAFLRKDDADMSRQAEASRRFSDGHMRILTTQITLALYQANWYARRSLRCNTPRRRDRRWD